jgi:UDP-N-acetylmuramyl pentapeptide phosphotransferase/UDP-N-acetylglucosamine-1-phosphate transferase
VTGVTRRTRRRSGLLAALSRVNHRGEPVSLVSGPIMAVAATAAAAATAGSGRARAAATVAGLGAGGFGLYDDVVGARPEQKSDKGFRGHLAALADGRVSAGMVKVAGIGATGLAAGLLIGSPGRTRRTRTGRLFDAVLAGGVVAGSANLANLLDLRPGRALKAGIGTAVPLALTPGGGEGARPAAAIAAATAGTAAALLPDDLDERTMLGDTGANALGALLGLSYAARTGRFGRLAALGVLVGLTAASERVSFTKVIESTPVLREIDALGRR